jgi:hypothetical protein
MERAKRLLVLSTSRDAAFVSTAGAAIKLSNVKGFPGTSSMAMAMRRQLSA